ncbi:bestrophin family protein [Flavobacterium saccharophilum]|uniref:Putative membrane protein n=1 Tax=Flavobacterium saccharophilum TaxID=29534 RepID=A0A1M7D317_9FLAO|nr:bestrophin family ion channel [Flavobacterium saccharophilum]SHL73854.1 putative membrane protein [Flavobacterium saccharophilum]
MLITTKIPISYLFNKVKHEIFYVLIIGGLVHYLTIQFENVIPVMPIAVPAFIGTAISVILSFKLSQSYDRWWEARKIWGSIVNDSRSFVLQLQSFVSKESHHEIRQIAFRHIAWCYSLGQNLRGLDAIENLQDFISNEDLEEIAKQSNKPLALLQLNTLQILELKEKRSLSIFSQIQINNTLVNFSNAMGMAERIKSTIFPVTYRIFLHFFIYIFIVTLSIALRDIKSYFEIPLLLTISTMFFLLEKSATHMQDPFRNRPTDTPMTAIARTIEINIKELLKESEIPKPQQPEKFYLS